MMARQPTRTSGGRRKVVAAAGLDCASAFQKIAFGCVTGIRAHHSSACAGDAEAVHQIRVAITRLRSVVAFFAPFVADAEWLRLKKEIAWLNTPLGAARDSDVVVEYARSKQYRAWAQHGISERLEQCRMHDHRRLVRCLRAARFRRLISAMAGWIRRGRWLARWKQGAADAAEPLQTYCERELNRRRKRLIRNGRNLQTLNDSRRHRLRIRIKRFRYMLEALTEIVPVRRRGKFDHVHRPAKRLQRTLGDLRDLQRFAHLAASVPRTKGDRSKKRPPGYRRQKQKVLGAAIGAYRDLEQAGAV